MTSDFSHRGLGTCHNYRRGRFQEPYEYDKCLRVRVCFHKSYDGLERLKLKEPGIQVCSGDGHVCHDHFHLHSYLY